MKKIFLAASLFTVALALSSCYNTKLLVGDVTRTEPLVEVNKEWNHSVIYGLIPLDNATMKVEDYVSKAPNYVIKTNQSLLNMLVAGVTAGLYTPTQTIYYLPADEAGER